MITCRECGFRNEGRKTCKRCGASLDFKNLDDASVLDDLPDYIFFSRFVFDTRLGTTHFETIK